MKDLSGGASMTPELVELPKSKPLYDEQFVVKDEHSGEPLAYTAYRLVTDDGDIFHGVTDAQGKTERIAHAKNKKIRIYFD
jgi:type VI secretion system secreted protein VgrG